MSSPALFEVPRRLICILVVTSSVQLACNAYDNSLPQGSGGGGGAAGAPGSGGQPSTNQGGAAGSPTDSGPGTGGSSAEDAPSNPNDASASDVSSSADAPIPGADHATSDAVSSDVVDASAPLDAAREVGAPADSSDVHVVDAGMPVLSMIDDMEDNDDSILPTDSRHGKWFVLNDGTAGAVQTPTATGTFTMTAIAGGRGASHYAARSAGGGFKSWSPVVGFWLNKLPAGLKQTYDASKYAGITFWARAGMSDGSPLSMKLRVQLPDKDTDPDGNVCGDAGACSDHFGKDIVLTSEWASYTIRFSDLEQSGFGMPAAGFDSKHFYGIEFQFELGPNFDCWIDDVALFSN